MTHNFTPWLVCLGYRKEHQRDFFIDVFCRLHKLSFTLTNPDAIDGGYRLEFRKGDAHVVADRWMSFPVLGETPGIAIHQDCEEWDCVFSARTPIDIVTKALNELAADEN